MATRNFWVEVDVDGRKTKFKGGPANKQGGMSITLYQRDNNNIIKPIVINCIAFTDEETGEITLKTFVNNNMHNDDRADSWGYVQPMTVTTKR